MDAPLARFAALLAARLGPRAVPRRFAKGAFVFREADPYLGPWLLREGAVVLVRTSHSGKTHIVRQVEPGEAFAEVPLFRELGRYPVDARCASRSTLLLLPADEVRRLLRSDPALAWAAAAALASRATELRDAIFELTLAEAKQRLLRYLLRRLEGRPNAALGVVPLGINLQDLALLLGIRPESLSRALTELEAAGKLKRLSRSTFQLFLKRITRQDREW
jgi:CRP/FNR family transcriptional regulator